MRYTPLLLAALFLGACATLPSPAAGPDRSGPLDAWIVPHEMGGMDGSAINFWVNRPAHVAIYQIAPMGGGAMLIYPRHSGGSSLHYAGFNSGFLGSQRAQRASAQFAFSPMAGSLGGFGPTYYLLVASERPLNVDRYAVSPMALQSDIPRLASMTVGQLANELTQLSLGPSAPPHGEWTTDLYVHWPMLPAPRTLLAMDTGVRMVQCPSGQVIAVAVGDPVFCHEHATPGQVGGDEEADEEEADERREAIRDYVNDRRDRGAARGDGADTDALRAMAEDRRERIRRTVEARERAAEMREARQMEWVRERNRALRDANRTRATRERPTREASPATTRTGPTSSGQARPASPPATRPTPAPSSGSQEERRERPRPDTRDRDGADD
jgi:hypothetical protein